MPARVTVSPLSSPSAAVSPLPGRTEICRSPSTGGGRTALRHLSGGGIRCNAPEEKSRIPPRVRFRQCDCLERGTGCRTIRGQAVSVRMACIFADLPAVRQVHIGRLHGSRDGKLCLLADRSLRRNRLLFNLRLSADLKRDRERFAPGAGRQQRPDGRPIVCPHAVGTVQIIGLRTQLECAGVSLRRSFTFFGSICCCRF